MSSCSSCSPNGQRSRSTTPARTRSESAAAASWSGSCEGLQATVTLDRELGGETDRGRVLELIVKRARALVDARSCLVLLLEGEELVVCDAAGEVDPADPRPPAAGRRVAARMTCLRSGVNQRVDPPAGSRLSALGVEAAAGLLVPLRSRGRTLGVLVALDRRAGDGSFSADEELLLTRSRPRAAGAIAATEAMRGGAEATARWPPRSASASVGRASCTTRRCRSWERCELMQESAVRLERIDEMRRGVERATEQVQRVIAGLERADHRAAAGGAGPARGGAGARDPRRAGPRAGGARDRDRTSTSAPAATPTRSASHRTSRRRSTASSRRRSTTSPSTPRPRAPGSRSRSATA